MGRHRTPDEKLHLRAEALRLRRAGATLEAITADLGVGGELLAALLGSEPPHPRNVRPRAKDDIRALAAQMRLAGRTYDDIALDLGVSKSSLSLWLRELPRPARVGTDAASGLLSPDRPDPALVVAPESHEERRMLARQLRLDGWLLKEIAAALSVDIKTAQRYVADLPHPPRSRHGGTPEHASRISRQRWARVNEERDAERRAIKAQAEIAVGAISQRDLHVAAVVAYWAEGSKDKPYARRERVTFVNSDPGMIRLWLTYLDDIDFPLSDRRFALSIHESADIAAATGWWAAVVGIPATEFRSPSVKRHQLPTVRKNVGSDYHGCLTVRLVRCRELYQRIEGEWHALVAGLAG